MKLGERILLGLAYFGILTWLAVPALEALNESPIIYGEGVELQSALLVLIPCVALLASVAARWHSLAWSMFWVWSLIFLGLASAYQLAQGKFPWLGTLRVEDISTAQRVIIIAHLAIIVGYFIRRRANPSDSDERATFRLGERPSLRSIAVFAINTHIIVAALFCVLMGPALFSGRLAFQQQLAGRGGIPGFGSILFIAQAGAIILPAMAIVLRRAGMPIHKAMICLSVVLSFVVTNPFIGSRFLTGSFLVALAAAVMSTGFRRWLPAWMILAFVTIFPTLDLLRGDGTGATEVAFTPPAQTLTTFDYDAFEMLTREVSLGGIIPGGVPQQSELLIAPFLRWLPFLSPLVEGDASGPVVAMSTGMGFTNVSMPLWGEAHLIGSWAGLVLAFLILGHLLSRTRNIATYPGEKRSIFGILVELPVAALLFIVLRGSLYEVLGYALLTATIGFLFARAERRDRLGLSKAGKKKKVWEDPYAKYLSPASHRDREVLTDSSYP